MKLTLSRLRVVDIWNGIQIALGDDAERKWKFNYALIRTKQKLRKAIEEINEMKEKTEKDIRKLGLECCARDSEDQTIYLPDGTLKGCRPGESVRFDDGAEDLINHQRTYMQEEIEIEVHEVEQSAAPKNMKGAAQEAVMYLIKEPKEDN